MDMGLDFAALLAACIGLVKAIEKAITWSMKRRDEKNGKGPQVYLKLSPSTEAAFAAMAKAVEDVKDDTAKIVDIVDRRDGEGNFLVYKRASNGRV